MHGSRRLRLVFFTFAGLQTAALFLDRRLIPYCGTFAMAALLAVAAASPSPTGSRRWTRYATLAGLGLLTLTAYLVDSRTEGYGWPAEFAGASGYTWTDMLEPALLTVGAGAIAAAVLGRVRRLMRWQHLPGVVLAVALIVAAADMAWHPPMLLPHEHPNVPVRLAVLLPAALVMASLVLAANAALASRGLLRFACAGMFALLPLTLAAMGALHDDDVLQPELDYAVTDTFRPGIHMDVWAVYPELASLPPGRYSTARVATFSISAGPRGRTSIAPDPAEPSDIEAVPGPPSWQPTLWDGDIDWVRSGPALRATFLLLGLVTLVTTLFPNDRGRLGDE